MKGKSLISILFVTALLVLGNAAHAAQITLDSLKSLNESNKPVPVLQYSIVKIDNNLVLPSKLYPSRKLPSMIDNIGLWYLVQGIKTDMPRNAEVKDALNVLIKYVEDKKLQQDIERMRTITYKTKDRVNAIDKIQEQVSRDSSRYEEEYIDRNDMQLLISSVRNDSTFQWLRKISRDSLELEFIDDVDSVATKIWVNTGMRVYKKVRLKTITGDTINSWLETLPGGPKMRLNVDGPESSKLTNVLTQNINYRIENPINKNNFNVIKTDKGELYKKYWTYYSTYDISMNQAAIKNWANGGQNSMSLLLKLGGYINYNNNKVSWENYLKCNLGMVWYKGSSPRKSDDYFEINTKMGYKAAKNWYYTFQFNLQTLLFNSYSYGSDDSKTLVANFLSPVYMVPSIGMNFKPNNRVSLLVSPIAGKITSLRDIDNIDPTRFGVESGKHTKYDVGLSINYNHQFKTLWKFLNLSSAFESFVYYDKKELSIPIYADWKMNFNFKINYFMSTTLYMELMYNESYSNKLQFKENLGLSVNFRL